MSTKADVGMVSNTMCALGNGSKKAHNQKEEDMAMKWQNQSVMEPDWFASEPAGYELWQTWGEDEWVVMLPGWEDLEDASELEVGRAPLLEDAMKLAEDHKRDHRPPAST